MDETMRQNQWGCDCSNGGRLMTEEALLQRVSRLTVDLGSSCQAQMKEDGLNHKQAGCNERVAPGAIGRLGLVLAEAIALYPTPHMLFSCVQERQTSSSLSQQLATASLECEQISEELQKKEALVYQLDGTAQVGVLETWSYGAWTFAAYLNIVFSREKKKEIGCRQ
eukprot:1161829-Pelagomonas_calceolata.AAC.4